MEKAELIQTFRKNHEAAVALIASLNEEKFLYRIGKKWSPAQHLKHISLTIAPFPGALSSKKYLREKFGSTGRALWDYETVVKHYLNTSLQAPAQFIPDELMFDSKESVVRRIYTDLNETCRLLGGYRDEELDVLVLPHPLLGKLSVREMICLMAYHPLHHLKQVETMLENTVQ